MVSLLQSINSSCAVGLVYGRCENDCAWRYQQPSVPTHQQMHWWKHKLCTLTLKFRLLLIIMRKIQKLTQQHYFIRLSRFRTTFVKLKQLSADGILFTIVLGCNGFIIHLRPNESVNVTSLMTVLFIIQFLKQHWILSRCPRYCHSQTI